MSCVTLGRSFTLSVSFSQLHDGHNKNTEAEKINCVDMYEMR